MAVRDDTVVVDAGEEEEFMQKLCDAGFIEGEEEIVDVLMVGEGEESGGGESAQRKGRCGGTSRDMQADVGRVGTAVEGQRVVWSASAPGQ